MAQSQVETKQQIVTYLSAQLQKQSEARDILSRLVINSPQLKIKQNVDIQSLEAMPLEQLQEEFQTMEKSFQQAVSFVKDQEEELDYQLESVRELEAQLKQAQASEKENVKNELAEEEDRYRFLEKTLVGQRRNLMSREDIIEQYKIVLKRRQGDKNWEPEYEKVDLSPIFNKIDNQRDYSEDEYHQVNEELTSLQTQVEELENTVKQQQQECNKTRVEIETLFSTWEETQKEANELSTRVVVNGETLHHQEEQLHAIQEKLNAISQAVSRIDVSEQQKQLSQVQVLLNTL
jgi:chromosome segregation ATPase